MSKQVKHLYEFGPFRLYPDEGLLLRHGDSVRLTPKAFETLVLFVRNPGHVLDKDELMEKLWPDTFVEEVNLAKNISSLRKVLREGGSDQLYIETLPKRGYRFVPPVRESWAAPPDPVSEQAEVSNISAVLETSNEKESQAENSLELPETFERTVHPQPAITPEQTAVAIASPATRHRIWIASAILAALLVGGAIFWLVSRRPTSTSPLSSQRIIPVTTYLRSETQPAISPDGKQVAFTWTGTNNDNWDIYVKLVGSGDPLRLTSEPVIERNPTWSPDSNHIAYLRESPDGVGVSVYVVSSLGGAPRKLTDTYGLGFDWSSDGESLILAERNSKDEPLSLFLFFIKTGEKRRLTFPPAKSFGDINPAFSPDGSTIAFARAHSGSTNAWDIYLTPVAGGDLKRLTFDETLIDGLDWTANGREIVFSSSRSGGLPALWRIATSGGRPEPLSGVGQNANSPSISRDGNRLAYVNSIIDSNIWRVDLSSSRHKATSPAMLISSTIYDHSPEYSPNGKRIAFASARSGSPEIWICNSDGSSPIQLTSFGGPATGEPRWSPDGQYIVFDSQINGNTDIFVMNVEGGNPRQLTSEGSEDIAPRWSRLGKWIFFTSNRTGESQIWRMSPDGSALIQVTKRGGYDAAESPDGKYLYYARGRNTSGLWRVSVDGGEESLVLDTLRAGYLRYWTVVDKGIYFGTRTSTPHPSIQFFSFATGQVNEVFQIEKPLLVGAPGLSISPDERAILFVQLDRSDSDIMLVEGFR